MATRIRYYVLKVKGLAKIPDYLQVRDERFSLIFYGRPDRPEKRTPLPCGFWEKLLALAPSLPYGIVCEVYWDTEAQALTWHERSFTN